MTNTNTSRAIECPVAALADEARKLIAAYNAVDEIKELETDSVEKIRLQQDQDTTREFLKGTMDRATYCAP